MTWTKEVKPLSTYTKVDKFNLDSLSLQTGDYLLLQDGCYVTLRNTETDSYTKVAKT